jgi:PAS domain-containing protein
VPDDWDSGQRVKTLERQPLRAAEALHASTLGVLVVVGRTIVAANPAACLLAGLEPDVEQPLPAWLEGADVLTRAAGSTVAGQRARLAFVAAPARPGGLPQRVVVLWAAESDGDSA